MDINFGIWSLIPPILAVAFGLSDQERHSVAVR